MKQTILFILLLIGLNSLGNEASAQKTDISKIVGQWSSEQTTVRLVFFYDNNKKLQLVQWDSQDGEETVIQKMEVKEFSIETSETMMSTNFSTRNVYRLKDINTIENLVVTDEEVTILFKRVK